MFAACFEMGLFVFYSLFNFGSELSAWLLRKAGNSVTNYSVLYRILGPGYLLKKNFFKYLENYTKWPDSFCPALVLGKS